MLKISFNLVILLTFHHFVIICKCCIFALAMNVEFFLAERLFGARREGKRISKPAVAIAQWGVAVGILVMTVSVCIVVGFKHEIRDKIIGFGCHIQVNNYEASEYGESAVTIDNDDIQALQITSGVSHVQTFIHKPGLISAGDEFEGIIIKGIGSDYNTEFIESHIVEGSLPQFTDTAASGSLVISRSLARKLNIKRGDKVNAYFVQQSVKARRLTVAAIYETHLTEADALYAFTDIYTTRRLNDWSSDKVTGIEIATVDYDALETTRDSVVETMAAIALKNGERLYVQTIEEMNPHLFSWLGVLDRTVWIILILVLGIAGFTMISGLLILILEKTNFIGILKAVGAKNIFIRRIFLYYATFIIGRGVLWGNITGIALCFLQQHTGIIALDPEMYYMNRVPIEFTWWLLPMNIAMFVISVAMLVLPSMLISRIEPTKAIRFE